MAVAGGHGRGSSCLTEHQEVLGLQLLLLLLLLLVAARDAMGKRDGRWRSIQQVLLPLLLLPLFLP
jgi:hypothetical protein